VLPSGQRLTLGLLATVTLEVVSFRSYALFSALLPFFKCVMEVVFCEGVQHRFCLHHLNYVKMADFHSGKQTKVGWLGDGSHVVFGQNFPDEKGSVRRCVVVMQQLVLSPKLGAKSSHIFEQAH
jgi:hypothetical protein